MNDKMGHADGTDAWELLTGSGHLINRNLAGNAVSF